MDRKPIYKELEKKIKRLSSEKIDKQENIEEIVKEVYNIEKERSSADFTLIRNLAKEVFLIEIQRRQKNLTIKIAIITISLIIISIIVSWFR